MIYIVFGKEPGHGDCDVCWCNPKIERKVKEDGVVLVFVTHRKGTA